MFEEKNWKKLVDYYKNLDIIRNDTKELLKKLNNNEELVYVVEGVIGSSALQWVDRKIPALNNGKPVNFVKSEEKIIKLKILLMEID